MLQYSTISWLTSVSQVVVIALQQDNQSYLAYDKYNLIKQKKENYKFEIFY